MTTALLMLLGSTAATDARQEKGQEGRSEGGHAQAAKRAGQHTQQAKPAAAQHTQAAHTRSQAKPAAQEHASAGESCAAKPWGNKSVARDAVHRRVDNAHYSRSFGSGHTFHVNRGDHHRHRFAYGGYIFGFSAPWPVDWGCDDDVYVVYTDGGYYMHDCIHPGLCLSIIIL